MTLGNKSPPDTNNPQHPPLPRPHLPVPYLELITSPTYLQSQDPTYPQPQYHWIDSICINQHSPTERSSQVSLMKRIYQQATSVSIYLGPSTPTSETALRFIRFLCFKVHEWKKGDKRFQRIRSPEFTHRWKALEELLLHPWWRRVWTLQEFIVATECSLYCGSSSVTRQELMSSLYCLYLCGGSDGTLVNRKAFNSAWNRRRIRQWYTDGPTSTPDAYHRMPLFAMIAYIGDSAASDDRDRVYSLLGMVSDSSLSLIPQPNYELSVETVYTNLVVEFVQRYESLDVICFSHLFNYSSLPATKRKQGRKLPTWVPDWRAQVEMEVTPVMASQSASPHIGNFRPLKELPFSASYTASGTSKPRVEFSANLREMRCEAVIVDVIDGLGGHPTEGAKMEQSRSQRNLTPKGPHGEDIFLTLARTLLLDRTDRYLNHALPYKPPPPPQRDIKIIYAMPTPDYNHHTTLRTLIEHCTPTHASYAPNSVLPLFREWCKENAQLMVKGNTWVRNPPPPAPPSSKPPRPDKALRADAKERARHRAKAEEAKKKEREKDLGPSSLQDPLSFLSRFRDTVTRMQRRLFVTSTGTLGMGPARAQRRDIVAVVMGCSIPLVLRRAKSQDGWDSGAGSSRRRGKRGEEEEEYGYEYELIGEAYLDGFMSGEALKAVSRGERKVVSLRLI